MLILSILLPMIGGTLMYFAREESKQRLLVLGTVFATALVHMVQLFTFSGEPIHLIRVNDWMDLVLTLDGLGRLFSFLIVWLWVLTAYYALGYLSDERIKRRRFFSFFLLTEAVTLGVSMAGNLLTLYLFYEFLTLATFPLVIHYGTEEALASGKKYLIYSFFGATLVLMGMILLMSEHLLVSFIPGGLFGGVYSNRSLWAFGFLFAGFSVKAAMVPFHSWLPGAMVAPTPVSALLHAVAVVKSGVFALLRVVLFVFGLQVFDQWYFRPFFGVLVLLTIVMGSLLALHQDHIKKRLAYSTISQLGYMLLGIVLANKLAITGAILHLVNHALIKISLFFIAGILYKVYHETDITRMKGVGKLLGLEMGVFGLSTISLIGIPPTNGFVSKWYLARGAFGGGSLLFVLVLLLSAFLTAAYLLPVVTAAFFENGLNEREEKKSVPLNMRVPVLVLGVLVALLGLFPTPVILYIESWLMPL